ncbi:MAG: hypothetical protein ACXVCY_04010 [Pseudobdellovibrionaceae bacterium]
MRNATVIEFPKAQSIRKRLQDKAQEQKAVIVISIASVLLGSVLLNQWLAQGLSSSSAGGHRNIASVNSNLVKDVKWEHDLANKFAADTEEITAAHIAETPTMRDELLFGFLEGKYGMKVSQGRIKSLEFIDAQAGEQPMLISDKAQFLTKYSVAFGLNFSEVSLAKNASGEQTYSLIDDSKAKVGEAHFITDDKGRVQTISFSK